MAVEIMLLFFGVYYILPPLVYYFLVPNSDYLNMSSEIIYKSEDITSMAPAVINVLAIYFISNFILIANITPNTNKEALESLILKNKSLLLTMLYIGLFTVFSMNLYLVYIAGGLNEFYFGSEFHERFNGGITLSIVMNFKSILPCFLLGISASLFIDRKTRLQTIVISVLLLLLFAFGGSNRKFMLLGFFIYFIIIVDIFGFKKTKRNFYILILLLFFFFQGLLFLRSSSFDVNALGSAFTSMNEVIFTSEPIGTYSNVLSLLNKFLNGDIQYSYFYDFLKIPLYPIITFFDISKPNIAHSLGMFLNGIEGFTFFPTIILEGFYNGGVAGCIVLFSIFSFLARYVQGVMFHSKNYLYVIFSTVIFNICLVQLIRGYLSVCIAYFLLAAILLILFKITLKLKR